MRVSKEKITIYYVMNVVCVCIVCLSHFIIFTFKSGDLANIFHNDVLIQYLTRYILNCSTLNKVNLLVFTTGKYTFTIRCVYM